MMTKKDGSTKKFYATPKLVIHGDVDSITLGDDLGEDLDAAFPSSGPNARGSKKRRNPTHS